MGKPSACNMGDPGSIPGLGRSPGEGNGNPLQYSCLGNPMDRGVWRATDFAATGSQRVGHNWATSLMSNDVVHLLMCFLTFYVVSLERGLCKSLSIFEKSYLSFCHWVVVVLYIFSMLKPHEIYDLQIFLPFLGLVSWLSWQRPLMHKNS